METSFSASPPDVATETDDGFGNDSIPTIDGFD
jgi:hypothetical protein